MPPAPTVALVDIASSITHDNSSYIFTFSSPLPGPCSPLLQSATPSTFSCTPSTLSPSTLWSLGTTVPASSSGSIVAGHSDGGARSATSVGVNQEPCPTVSGQFQSGTVKASSAPVMTSLTADREDGCSYSAPASLYPLVNQPSVTSSSSSSRFCTPTPSSTANNQSICSQSHTSSTSSGLAVESQAPSAIFCPPVFGSTPVSTSSHQVSGWPATTNASSSFTHASTQSFGSLMSASNCTGSSTFSFQFGNEITTRSSMDIGQPLGTPALTSTNCQCPVTTCWRWHSSGILSQGSSTLPPSTRSSPFWSTPSNAESDARFGLESCHSTTAPVFGFARTSSQPTTAVEAGNTFPPTTVCQSSSRQHNDIKDRQSSTSVCWTSQNTVMSTTTSQPALHDTTSSASHVDCHSKFITVFVYKVQNMKRF